MNGIIMNMAKAVADVNGYKSPDDVKLLCSYSLFDGHHYVVTDWHMWIKDRDTDVKPTPVRARDNYEDIITRFKNAIGDYPNTIINLGDLVDDEFYEFFTREEQIAIFDEMFDGTDQYQKYLIKGNNDHWDYEFLYERYGWTMVDAIYCENYILTHMPINLRDNGLENFINIHGHSHGHGYYWISPFTNHLDLWNIEREPFKMDKTDIAEAIKSKADDIKDIYHLGLKSKSDFIKYRGCNKHDNEI